MITKEAAIHLVFYIIFNQSCKNEVSFKAPGELLRRLNWQSYDLHELEARGFEALYEIIRTKPCLHRFPGNMAKYIYSSVQKINEKYESDPRNIWRGKQDDEIIKELTSLNGVGLHKAIQCLFYLNALGEVGGISEKYIDSTSEKCAGFFNNVDSDLQVMRLL